MGSGWTGPEALSIRVLPKTGEKSGNPVSVSGYERRIGETRSGVFCPLRGDSERSALSYLKSKHHSEQEIDELLESAKTHLGPEAVIEEAYFLERELAGLQNIMLENIFRQASRRSLYPRDHDFPLQGLSSRGRDIFEASMLFDFESHLSPQRDSQRSSEE